MSEYQHHIICNYPLQPIGSLGCQCKIITKKEFNELQELKNFVKAKLDNINELPCRVDEMTERESQLNQSISELTATLQWIDRKLEMIT